MLKASPLLLSTVHIRLGTGETRRKVPSVSDIEYKLLSSGSSFDIFSFLFFFFLFHDAPDVFSWLKVRTAGGPVPERCKATKSTPASDRV